MFLKEPKIKIIQLQDIIILMNKIYLNLFKIIGVIELLVLFHLKYLVPSANQIMFANEFEILLVILFFLQGSVVVCYMIVHDFLYYLTTLLRL